MQLEVRHFWKHRGVEKLFEQLTLIDAVLLAERVSGDTTIGHSLAYCQAVETLLHLNVPRRARYLRSLFLELERLYNHLGDIGAMCNDTAYALAHAHCGRMKERVMQLNDRLVGSRFLRGVMQVGESVGTSIAANSATSFKSSTASRRTSPKWAPSSLPMPPLRIGLRPQGFSLKGLLGITL